MASSSCSSSSSTQRAFPQRIHLPHPYLTAYDVVEDTTTPTTSTPTTNGGSSGSASPQYRVLHRPDVTSPCGKGVAPPVPLHHPRLAWTAPQPPDLEACPALGDNSSWARARRTPLTAVSWSDSNSSSNSSSSEGSPPSVPQFWLLAYALVTLHPKAEVFRVALQGPGAEELAHRLCAVGLLVPHPAASAQQLEQLRKLATAATATATATDADADADAGAGAGAGEFLLFAGSFWQGAGSPTGPRPIWLAEHALQPSAMYPAFPHLPAAVTAWPPQPRHTQHPVRPAKPAPGSVVYSRWIPHLGAQFSIVALDWRNSAHVRLFHAWQNDPRVAAGWNETGSVEAHTAYLRRQHEDLHTLALLARFDGAAFAYFEVYWAKEDHMGAHFDAGAYDRGRHSLVGDARFRGPHRVAAWWSGLMHFMFLDEPRTMRLVGEPRATNTTVLDYDARCGFHVLRFVDLPHKRSAVVACEREWFFQLCPLAWEPEGEETGEGGVVRAVARL
ncbi:uncharacterized protein K452DRAFT_353189 [Aplosporella prunicola CBS 121167]|uniref:Acyltransferase MbtK/IucB-like conserved domain-containing protein n=1 Tax=Aplosporella prunicola CBS 121167 TaxID=1176127 RepID=A0A6A6B541_9PEZI|nr:uncharacterized protein K452DRAFT_353189 [Aplosporella prunicola CBS 121167]KAF2138334.1 hypothetical protein K452DRAFT_353189 [Aplosporella prunicola CBS 121167]